MQTAMPGNAEEAAYIAFAAMEELMAVLIQRGYLRPSDSAVIFKAVAGRLSQQGSFAGQRAAQFIADRMTGEE